MFKHLGYIACLLCLIVSCKKQKDSQPPLIEIESPYQNQIFNALDTIHITGNITDETAISSVSISLVDANQNPGANTATLKPTEKNYNLNYYYVLNDIHLESGTYTLQIGASDGINDDKEFIKIQILAEPKVLNNIYVFCNNAFNTTDMYQLDLSFNITHLANYNLLLQDAVVNSYYQQFSILSHQGIIETYDTEDLLLQWSASNLHLSPGSFNGSLEIFDNSVYTGTSEGKIFGYDNNGNIRKTATISSSSHAPGYYTKFDNYLFVSCIPVVPVIGRIEKLNYETGYSMDYYEIDLETIKMFPFNSENIIIWGNHNNVAKVCTLSAEYNVLYQIDDFNSEILHDVVQPDHDNYVLAAGSSVYTYNSSSKILNEVIQGFTFEKLFFNPDLNKLFITNGQHIYIYNYPDFSLFRELTFPDNIVDLCFLYNK